MKNDRHAKVEVQCKTCGQVFSARKERVDKGLGRFCSKNCFDIDQRERNKFSWGRKDLAKTYKVGGRYAARWYDGFGKTRSESYARWWWEMNVGEIPDKMIVLYKDNNPLNIEPSNFYLGTKSDALVKGNATRKKDEAGWQKYIEASRQRQLGFKHTPESKAKISKIHLGKIGLRGDKSPNWRGGIEKKYPREFFEVRDFVIGRDKSKCQICSKNLNSRGYKHVHHIDGNRYNNDQNNLVLVCPTCHGKIHSKSEESPPIMAFRSRLEWSK